MGMGEIIAAVMCIVFLGIFLSKLFGKGSDDSTDFNDNSDLKYMTIGYHGYGLGITFYEIINGRVVTEVLYSKLSNKKEAMEFIKSNNMFIGDSFKCKIDKRGNSFIFKELSERVYNRKVNNAYEIRVRKLKSEQLLVSELDYKDIDEIFSQDKEYVEGTYKLIGVTDLNDDVDDLLWVDSTS